MNLRGSRLAFVEHANKASSISSYLRKIEEWGAFVGGVFGGKGVSKQYTGLSEFSINNEFIADFQADGSKHSAF